ncbi:MAG: MerR family transcriptional regulator [Gammaproteobacteria bacterium]|jgi:DNA-binding transcriptional MerR regulator|nr:MerR family transcriptional regulator [Gammaproteobacteria bacterium]
MKSENTQMPEQFNINQLSELTGFSVRSIRYYVQQGVLDKPEGIKRNAFYQRHHLEQLMLIKKGQDAGYSLDRINQMIRHPETFKPTPEQQAGTLSVKTHILLAQGVELVISPDQAGFSAEQLRELAKQCIESIQKLKEKSND